ncbi:MAG: M14 family zinc carboxypeptidase [Actinomycetes bacterium]
MLRRGVAVAGVMALTGALLGTLPAGAAPSTDRGRGLEVYVGQVDAAELEKLHQAGLDHEDISTGHGRDGEIAVEVVMNGLQAAELAQEGVDLAVKRIDGKPASRVAAQQNARGYEGFRTYGGAGGIAEELRETAAANPRLAKLVSFGETVQGTEMLAVKLTKNARIMQDGKRPAVMYLGAQHAREWITPEMVRRLMHHVLDGYGRDPQITRILNTTELWFVPVANPDGYDHTFTVGNRLWRKNLADNDADGAITGNDGVDLNRNYATKWGWDNEGSSPNPSSQTYRGPAPTSEPESVALDGLFARVGFEQLVNYHSAAELLLYGIGWQVNTPSPDDVILEAMAGTDQNPAVPGYDPDISAELYTTNGDTDTHMTVAHDTLGFTPEMTTCQVASEKYDDDRWEPEHCVSGFNFPDDDRLITEEFEKNIPFALSVARSAKDPSDPVTFDGSEAPEMVADEFAVSHGTDQPVAVIADRKLDDLTLNYRFTGGEAQTTTVSEWEGGEKYGDTHDDHYAEFRGTVTGAAPGETVEVWFTGTDPDDGEQVATDPFTYTVAQDVGGDVLVLAAEDYTGLVPAQDPSGPHYADEHVAAVEAAGYDADVYDIDANDRTEPHHLGVLSHYDAVLWESGDDLIPRAPGQPGGTADDWTLAVELSVRDYLNEGGKVLVSGKYNRYAESYDGLYYYNPFDGECTTYGRYPCLPLFNDFLQYWLGAFSYVSDGGTDPEGNPYPVAGTAGTLDGFEGLLNAEGSAQNQDHTASFLTTSSFLPPEEFPQFASSAAADWLRPGGAPYDPRTGEWYVYSQQDDVSWKRLSRTVDLTGASAGELGFWTSYDIETDWDYLFVEARPVGTDEWTTLPDANGHTRQGTGRSCTSGWDELHPFIAHYQGADCSPTGTTGEWHAATGGSNGWQQWSIDLSRFAGEQVEISISYASDWGTQGLGVFVDDATVTIDGAETASTSFEEDLGGWVVSGAPDGSDPNNNDWQRDQLAFEEGAVVVTEDTVFAGFGLEGFAPQQRDDFVARALEHLLG